MVVVSETQLDDAVVVVVVVVDDDDDCRLLQAFGATRTT